MSKVITTTVLPDVVGGTVTLGGTGDSVVVTGNDIRANVLQDAGGNAVLTSNGSGVLSGMNSGFGGALNLLSTQTASNSASISFTTQLTSTYDVYIFKFLAIGNATNGVEFQFNVSTDGGSNYNLAKTSTYFQTYHPENDADNALSYRTPNDLANGTGDQIIGQDLGGDADCAYAGTLHLFNPSSTTYVKHFYCTGSHNTAAYAEGAYSAGYINSTSDIDAIIFRMSSGTFDGIIKLYGISKS